MLVDGCKVFPRTSNNLSTIIPLANNSEFEIHSKRFRFSYPPKEIRATLFATPARQSSFLLYSTISLNILQVREIVHCVFL